jgi:ketol-acid reductoisomerase
MAYIDFGGTKEEVITRKEFPMAKARKVLKNEVIAIIGYGVQGPAQSLNLRDNGFNVSIGQAKSFKRDWDRAVKDGWVPGKTLFDIAEAVQKGTIIQMLVSDAAQRAIWPLVKKNL